MKNDKIEYLILFYGDYYKKWKAEKDDRKLFCNILENLIETAEDYNNIKSVGAKVALNRYIKEEEEVLKKIIKNFS